MATTSGKTPSSTSAADREPSPSQRKQIDDLFLQLTQALSTHALSVHVLARVCELDLKKPTLLVQAFRSLAEAEAAIVKFSQALQQYPIVPDKFLKAFLDASEYVCVSDPQRLLEIRESPVHGPAVEMLFASRHPEERPEQYRICIMVEIIYDERDNCRRLPFMIGESSADERHVMKRILESISNQASNQLVASAFQRYTEAKDKSDKRVVAQQILTDATRHCSCCGRSESKEDTEKAKATSTLRRCGRCKLAHYCNVGCQRQDWKAQHKAACTWMAECAIHLVRAAESSSSSLPSSMIADSTCTLVQSSTSTDNGSKSATINLTHKHEAVTELDGPVGPVSRDRTIHTETS